MNTMFNAPSAALFTTEVTTIDTLRTVQSTLSGWLNKTVKQHKAFKFNHRKDRTEENLRFRLMCKDSFFVLNRMIDTFKNSIVPYMESMKDLLAIESDLSEACPVKEKGQAIASKMKALVKKHISEQYHVYVAFTDDKCIQGVAITSIIEEGSRLWLHDIIANPDEIVQKERQIKGIGLALMKQVATCMKKEECGALELYSMPSSIGFYKRLGFESASEFENSQSDAEKSSDSQEEKDTKPLKLDDEKLDSFLERCEKVGELVEKEPVFLDHK